ncbi:MAG: glycosyltransferase [Sphingobacteriales bacterium]|nr:glycosyltransferase [Sphingobacteriales bacterium]OJV97929.1 MAG: hypothetical protein BGO52_10790 [Sphingobacteriales bacterium 44-61]
MDKVSPFFSFVILEYNRKKELEKTVERIEKAAASAKEVPYEVIVVVNGSGAQTFESFRILFRHSANVKLVELDKNIGISGWNNGAEIAKGQYLWFLDDDSYPLEESIQQAYTELCGGAIQAAACRVIHQPGASGLVLEANQDHCLSKVFCGCGFILERKVFVELRGFWDQIFVYAHEKEFAVRLDDSGVSIIYLHNVVVNHDAVARLTDMKYYHTFRSTALINLRFLSFWKARLMIMLYLIRNITSIKPKYYKPSFLGIKDAFKVVANGKISRVAIRKDTQKKYFI